MELFRSDSHFIFVKENYSLWWDKQTGEFAAKSDWEWGSALELECLGIFYGLIGKIEQPNVLETRLMLIKEVADAGVLQGGHVVHKIKSVAFLHLGSENFDIGLLPCAKHQHNAPGGKKPGPSSGAGLLDAQRTTSGLAKTWGTIKSAGNSLRTTTQQAAALATSQVKSTVVGAVGKRTGLKDKERFERRIIEELGKIFTETDSFFFCRTRDITNSLQRSCERQEQCADKRKPALWRTVDNRFFWNRFMLQDIINLNTDKADCWILPIIQGYVQIEKCQVEVGHDEQPIHEIFNLAIISRRSRFRAGTRYKRRGVDEDGKCANYVETEQLVWYHDHQVSFVQVRGSVPVYWSQPGYKYKPPPRIDRGEAETQVAFDKHFAGELETYGPVCIVNLVEQSGKEAVIWEAYTNHVLGLDHPDVTYTTFDFHEYCRGMHFENVSLLVTALSGVLAEMGYCWHDKQGAICKQRGVFRVNCIDCLDRTNVVQTALGKAVMEMQFSKLGLVPPDGALPTNIRQTFQLLWANNGDIISKQYAGTNALKGDYTRTGERKFTGLMKDGMNSANRYYLNRFKDAYRQAGIDMMLGNHVNEEVFHENADEHDSVATADHVKLLIEDCKKLLIPDPESVLNSWGLIDADPVTGDPTETEMDSILILTRDSYYIADYDEQIDKVTNYQRVLLTDVVLIECGQPETTVSLFKNKSSHYCIRINYKVGNDCGYFHMFRSTNLRFFNNMAVVIKTEEETIESLKAIAEAIAVASELEGIPKIPIAMNVTLDKRRSKIVNAKGHAGLLDIASFPSITRNVSETQLNAIKSVGTKAFSNMSEQFSKLNKFGHSLASKRPMELAKSIGKKDVVDGIKPTFTLGKREIGSGIRRDSDGSDDSSASDAIDVVEHHGSHDARHKPDVGALLGLRTNDVDEVGKEVDGATLGNSRAQTGSEWSSSQKNHATTPEITIQGVGEAFSHVASSEKATPPSFLNLPKNISHSTGEVDSHTNPSGDSSIHIKRLQADGTPQRSSSEQDLTVSSISTSHSESAIKTAKSNFTNASSPVATAAKEILSPFSKLAKGVQNLGANLDPRKLKPGQTGLSRNFSEHQLEERAKMIEKWSKSRSKLIFL
ncbi:phosphatidylinositide phosphatase SAC2 isoform X2 [Trichogramma pretiosum]|uniref:phosphatidylinositide phosphatase SAC2 isoform X2 n=1 Tax=Trichogramma pretiosum TaxID=7493 RepID=UPI0006C979AC|nr:phosphatidylinositide phosphatase SAC2 isoform X2 [Trichogramma pretiosum]